MYLYYLNASDVSELNDDLNDECLNVCIYVEKLFMLKNYSCSLSNNNAQSDKTVNKLSIN